MAVMDFIVPILASLSAYDWRPMSDLKPCPFCGSEAKFWEERTDYVSCTKVSCTLGSDIAFHLEIWQSRPGEDAALDRAVKAVGKAICPSCREGTPKSIVNGDYFHTGENHVCAASAAIAAIEGEKHEGT